MRASSSDRGVTCPASLELPVFARPMSESRQRALDWGTLVHSWKETGEMDPRFRPADRLCLATKLERTGVTREVYWPGGHHELTFAINLETASPLLHDPATGIPADPWKSTFDPTKFLTGTIDWWNWNVDGDGDVLDDLKTGRWPVDAKTSRQLRSYALLPWVMAGRPDDYSILTSITQWPRYPMAGKPTRTFHALSGGDLEDHLDDLRWAVAHPNEVNPTEEGCRFCECKPGCPSWTN